MRTPLERILNDPRISREQAPEQATRYSAVGVVSVIAKTEHPAQFWDELKSSEPALARYIEHHDILGDVLDLAGVMRLIQSIDSPRAEALKRWMIENAQNRIDEANDPELAFQRAQKLYRRRGYTRRWVDKRLRSVSTRQELVSEWARRGATDSEHYRELTNTLMSAAFGMDVEGYRRYKNLSRTNQKLRDHMTDVELALLALAETSAVSISSGRNSVGVEQLRKDATEAGAIARRTLHEIERASGRDVIDRSHHATNPAREAA